jgi:predicted nucleotidyltransferase
MRRTITAKLNEIATEEGVRVLLAVESGSRAWGFHSPDSDYDVRFVYARPLDWHFRLGKKRDVIERPIDDELDISGWELSKALTLAMGSNAVIAEWLQSPIVYQADAGAVEDLTRFARQALDRKSVAWHYLSLLRRQQDRSEAPGGGVRIKRFFYTLRPALSLRWMRLQDAAMPPMDMARLMAGCDLPAEVSAAILALIAEKKQVLERAQGTQPDAVLTSLIADEAALAEAWLATAPKRENKALWDTANTLHQRLSLGDSR